MALVMGPTCVASQLAQSFGFQAKPVETGQRDLLIPLRLHFRITDTEEMDCGSLAYIVARQLANFAETRFHVSDIIEILV